MDALDFIKKQIQGHEDVVVHYQYPKADMSERLWYKGKEVKLPPFATKQEVRETALSLVGHHRYTLVIIA